MNTVKKWLTKPRLSLIYILLGLFAISCDAEEFSLQIKGVAVVDPTTCLPGSSSSGQLMTQGAIDLIIAQDYQVTLALQNLLVDPRSITGLSEKEGGVNTPDVTLTEVKISYLDPDEVGIGIEEDLTVPLGGVLKTGEVNPSFHPVKVLTRQMVEILLQNGIFRGVNESGRLGPTRGSFHLVLSLQVKGETLDGKNVESNSLSFPVEVCLGCRVRSGINSELNSTECQQITEAESTLSEVCPEVIGRDLNFTSCALCRDFAVDEPLAALCIP